MERPLPRPAKKVERADTGANLGFEEIRAHDFVLTPGRYVGAEEAVDDGSRSTIR